MTEGQENQEAPKASQFSQPLRWLVGGTVALLVLGRTATGWYVLASNHQKQLAGSESTTPAAGEANYDCGVTYADTTGLERAIADYTRSIQSDANNAQAYFCRGESYRRKGEPDRAISTPKPAASNPIWQRRMAVAALLTRIKVNWSKRSLITIKPLN